MTHRVISTVSGDMARFYLYPGSIRAMDPRLFPIRVNKKSAISAAFPYFLVKFVLSTRNPIFNWLGDH